jgi:cell division septal protein FtsQ
MIYRRNKHFVASRNRYRGFSRFIFWFTLIVFLGAVVYTLFFSAFLMITSFKISGEKCITESDIMDIIKPELSGKFLSMVNRNNLLLVKKDNIRRNILEKFRQIREVEVRKEFPSELDVRLTERIPTILFQGANGWFIIDENAVAYDTADPNAEEITKYDLLRLTDSDGKNVELGTAALSEGYVAYVIGIREKMKSDTEIQLSNDFQTPSLISKDIRAKTQEGWGIYFNENITLDKEIEMLNAVLNHEINKNQRPDLEYIDLRIDNKVYYKFRDGTPEETARLAAEEAAKNVQVAPVITTLSNDTDKKKKK